MGDQKFRCIVLEFQGRRWGHCLGEMAWAPRYTDQLLYVSYPQGNLWACRGLRTPKANVTGCQKADTESPPSSRTGHSSELKASTPTPLFPHGPRNLTMSLRSPLISWVLNISAYKIGRWLHPSFSSRRFREDPVYKAGGKMQSECTLDLVSEPWNRQSCPSDCPLWSLISSPNLHLKLIPDRRVVTTHEIGSGCLYILFCFVSQPSGGFWHGYHFMLKAISPLCRHLRQEIKASWNGVCHIFIRTHTRTHPLHSGACQMCMSLTFPPCLSNEPFNQTGNKARWLASEIFSTPSPALLMLCSYFGGSYFFGIHWCKSCIDFLLEYKSIDGSLF